MEKRNILDILREQLPFRMVHFVFPTAVTADFWAFESAQATGQAVDKERFIAWDTYKDQAFSVPHPEQKKSNRALRFLFASQLLAENAMEPFLKNFVNPAFASSYTAFVAPLARLLVPLDGILRKAPDSGAEDPYCADLKCIHDRYIRFMEEHNRYEPLWNRPPLVESDKKYLLFFPELCEDWEEFRHDLESEEIISLDAIARPQSYDERITGALGTYTGAFLHFPFSGDEYRWIALTIRHLYAAGVALDDIVISYAGNGDPERLMQELHKYDIPVESHHGKQLTEHPGGRIYASLANCRSQKWSYRALKNLLLDRNFPWKNRKLIDALLEAGLRYRCLSGWNEHNYGEVDVWEKSLYENSHQVFAGVPVPEIREFYIQLKKDITAILEAKTFKNLQSALFTQFENHHFDKNAKNIETKKLTGIAITLIRELIETEEEFTASAVDSSSEKLRSAVQKTPVFPIFQAYVQDHPHVYKSPFRGVALYDYKVAAGIGPAVHFIVNTNQRDAAVSYPSSVDFLREDRKNLLDVQNRDMSDFFVRAYELSGSIPIFTASDRTFSGATVALPALQNVPAGEIKYENLPVQGDPYQIEWLISAGKEYDKSVHATAAQKLGWNNRTILSHTPVRSDFRTSAIVDPLLRDAVRIRLGNQKIFRDLARSKAGLYSETSSVSPTDLDEYQQCPFQWVWTRGLGVGELQTDVKTIDQRELGILYHGILERLFGRIQSNETRFRAEDIPRYIEQYLSEEIDATVTDATHREGFFQKSVYEMLKNRIRGAISHYFEHDKETLNGAEIVGAEYPLRKVYPDSTAVLAGTSDLILKKEDDSFAIIDFKTSHLPALKDITGDEPQNLQLAAYIGMFEGEQSGAAVSEAHFYSIDRRESRAVVSEKKPRPDYDSAVAAVDNVFADIQQSLDSGSYMAAPGQRKQCLICTVSSVCRMLY